MLDTPVFKKLAHNDTGKARGHQGGIVIPAGIAKFFPPLTIPHPSSGPTVDTRLNAELFVDGKRVGLVSTRYQYQTWGGTRSPERRLTDNLGLLRNAATKDDILLFSKDLYDDSFIRLDLLRQGTAEYTKLDAALVLQLRFDQSSDSVSALGRCGHGDFGMVGNIGELVGGVGGFQGSAGADFSACRDTAVC